MLQHFEELATARYRALAEELLLPEKELFVSALTAAVPDYSSLQHPRLQEEVETLAEAMNRTTREGAFTALGLVLENMGSATYQALLQSPAVSPETRELAGMGYKASEAVRGRAQEVLPAVVGQGEELLWVFTATTGEVLQRLDAFGQGVDDVFAEPLQIEFADLMADATAGLLTQCLALGLDRRRVMGHLTSALMES